MRSVGKLQVRAYIANVRDTEPCYFCGETDPVVKEFHHIEPSHKCFDVSNSWRHKGMALVVAEIAKCLVVCASCHRRVEAGVLEINDDPHGEYRRYLDGLLGVGRKR